ncbi:MAG: hypothetical protein SW833_06590 [Cyanobacteriota bacterium]|nr:hypothetical protein [Cyanobacteriota bacterium]
MTLDNRETLERMARWIANLPSEHLLHSSLTVAQKQEWQKLKETQSLMAEAWRSQFLNVKGGSSPTQFQSGEGARVFYYPIEEALDRGEISQYKADLLLLSVKEYQARWELCQQAEKYLRATHSALQDWNPFLSNFQPLAALWNRFFSDVITRPYPFESAEDLWAESIRADVDDTFSICLRPYYDVPLKKWRQASQFLVGLLGETGEDGQYRVLKDAEVVKLKHRLVWSKLDFSWLGAMLLVCQIYTRKDPRLRQALITYNKSLRDVQKRAITASRKLRGFAWKEGEILYASGRGGVYR